MSGSGPITRRGFIGGALPRRARRQGARAGLCRARRKRGWICAGRARQDVRISRRPRPASGIPHRVVVCDRQSRRRAVGRPMARNGRCFVRRSRPGAPQEGWANQQIWMGHAAVTRADTHRFSQAFARGGVGQAGVDAKPFRAWIDAWEMRGLDADERRQHRAARAESIGRRFQLRAAPRRGPAAGAAGRRRLQPQIAARTGLLLLQPAALYGEGQPHHRRQACRRHRTGLARSRVEQPAAGLRSKRMGLALAAFQRAATS